MKRLTMNFLAVVALTYTSCLFAQDSLVGTYTGYVMVATRASDAPTGLELTIASVENGVVTGVARLSRKTRASTCAGEYPIRGTIADNTLKLRSTEKSGVAGDCSLFLELKQEGDKLVGTRGAKQAVELTKS